MPLSLPCFSSTVIGSQGSGGSPVDAINLAQLANELASAADAVRPSEPEAVSACVARVWHEAIRGSRGGTAAPGTRRPVGVGKDRLVHLEALARKGAWRR